MTRLTTHKDTAPVTKQRLIILVRRIRLLRLKWSGNPLQNSGLENPMDRGAWRAIVRGVGKCRTLLSTPQGFKRTPYT